MDLDIILTRSDGQVRFFLVTFIQCWLFTWNTFPQQNAEHAFQVLVYRVKVLFYQPRWATNSDSNVQCASFDCSWPKKLTSNSLRSTAYLEAEIHLPRPLQAEFHVLIRQWNSDAYWILFRELHSDEFCIPFIWIWLQMCSELSYLN